jgi:mono/diheme cytochrome c family protein
MKFITNRFIIVVMLTSIIAAFASCSKDPNKPGLEYVPDMYRSPAYKAYGVNGMFSDSSAALLPVEGTIPRDYEFFNYDSSNEGYEAASRDLVNPLPHNEITLYQGKYLYENFCMHCHGASGDGDGALIATGKFPPPPSYKTGASSRGGMLNELTDGKIFHTITYGINLMGPHASQLNSEERWKITMYVHELIADGKSITASETEGSGNDAANN